MCLDTALRAAHRRGGRGNVQPLERAQEKGLLLPARKLRERLLERRDGLIDLETLLGLRLRTRRLGDRVRLVLIILAAEWQPGDHPPAHRAPALHVADAVLENAVEERLPFRRRPPG